DPHQHVVGTWRRSLEVDDVDGAGCSGLNGFHGHRETLLVVVGRVLRPLSRLPTATTAWCRSHHGSVACCCGSPSGSRLSLPVPAEGGPDREPWRHRRWRSG